MTTDRGMETVIAGRVQPFLNRLYYTRFADNLPNTRRTMYQSDHLSHTDAMRVIAAIQAEVDKEGKGAAIAVVDEHGELIAFVRTDGCRLSSITIAINKAYTAAREHKPSREVGESSREN